VNNTETEEAKVQIISTEENKAAAEEFKQDEM